MEFGHTTIENRVGQDGNIAEVGDVVQVVKGRKYPVGMKFVVTDAGWFNFNGYPGYHDKWMLEFYDCDGKHTIDPDNVRIVAQKENRKTDSEYKNVHRVEVFA